MFKRFVSMTTAAFLLAVGLSVAGAGAANAADIADGSTVALVAMSSTMAGGGNCSPRQAISTPTRVRTLPDGENGEFDSATTNTFVWNSTNQAAFDVILARAGTTRTTFTPVSGSAYTFYQLREGSTSAFYFCHAGQVDLLVNGTNSITGWAVAGSIFFTGGSAPAPSTPTLTAAEIAAAAAAAVRAAEAAAAAIRAAEIATAQTALSTILKSDKAGTLSEYRAANINVTTAASLTRLNAEVLKLSGSDRTDFAKIKALADKIEFDEAFFNATARPSIATYAANGVTGITERILPVVNAKVLELPAAQRSDIKAIQELVKVESFVDRVANTATRSTVSAVALIERGLFPANSIYKFSVVRGLGSYPEGSLNTVAKIEAAVKEQIFKAEAPKRRLAEIKAQIAARKK
jgi:hypothetical protein